MILTNKYIHHLLSYTEIQPRNRLRDLTKAITLPLKVNKQRDLVSFCFPKKENK